MLIQSKIVLVLHLLDAFKKRSLAFINNLYPQELMGKVLILRDSITADVSMLD